MQVIDLAHRSQGFSGGPRHAPSGVGDSCLRSDTEVTEADVSRVLARIERERRAGHKDISEALEAAIEDAQSAHLPRRRRRRSAKKMVEPDPEEIRGRRGGFPRRRGIRGDRGFL